jgi:hypothetical protein
MTAMTMTYWKSIATKFDNHEIVWSRIESEKKTGSDDLNYPKKAVKCIYKLESL